MPNRLEGKVIVLEGTDASGKGTQSRELTDRLEQSGYKVSLLSFPRYEEPFGMQIRRYLCGE